MYLFTILSDSLLDLEATQLFFCGVILTRDMSGKNNSFYGKKHTDETKAKIAASRKGKPLSEATKAKLSAASRNEYNPFYGKMHTAESKSSMSDSKSGVLNPMYGKKKDRKSVV